MKAVVWTRYGPPEVLELREVEKPTPKKNEVLVHIHATTVTAGDCEFRRLDLPMFLGIPTRMYMGITRPKRVSILGQELAGEIEAIGTDVTRFAPGDQVFAATDFNMGAYAEYRCLPVDSEDVALARKPSNMTYEEAAAVPMGGLEALHFLRKTVHAGDDVLVVGAGGSIGTHGMQIAKHLGASEVTGVDSTEKLDTMRAAGADHVIDYTAEDFTKGSKAYDVIFDVVGVVPFSGAIGVLKENGRLAIANLTLPALMQARRTTRKTDKTVVIGTSSRSDENLAYLVGLIEAGELRSVIGRTFPLEEIVAAHRYVEAGHKKGNLVITVG